jgi:hypothetical protein
VEGSPSGQTGTTASVSIPLAASGPAAISAIGQFKADGSATAIGAGISIGVPIVQTTPGAPNVSVNLGQTSCVGTLCSEPSEP